MWLLTFLTGFPGKTIDFFDYEEGNGTREKAEQILNANGIKTSKVACVNSEYGKLFPVHVSNADYEKALKILKEVDIL